MWHVAVHSLHQSIVNVAAFSSRSRQVLEPIGHAIHTVYYFSLALSLQRYPSSRLLHNCTYTNSFIGYVSLSTTTRLQKGGLRVHIAQYVLCTAGLSQLRRYRCGSEPLSRQTHSLTHTSYYESYRDLTTMILLIESGMYYRVCNMGISAIRAAFPHFSPAASLATIMLSTCK
jgi:hypothetical protein